ncbi:hypothetical protein C0Q70_19947 [Pomacea canaliculata]|uniref:G-protein coupled receptors family 2 profile 2 domain-containing protein n=1 Tax=Pomacea canaliculata TaxID=400727 RepID=A0A2T7NE54_POMCA|nr:hypothetical protein C0Q70_19947 [Pomacea canaliculata]
MAFTWAEATGLVQLEDYDANIVLKRFTRLGFLIALVLKRHKKAKTLTYSFLSLKFFYTELLPNYTFITKECTATAGKLFRFMDCTLLPTSDDVYYVMVSRCDNSTTAPNSQQQQQLCEGDSGNDTITKVPVVLKTNKHIIFKNIFCAFCHDYKLRDLDTDVFYYGYYTNSTFSSYDALERDMEQKGRICQQDESTNMNLLCRCTPTDLVKSSTLGLTYKLTHFPLIRWDGNFNQPQNEDSWSYYTKEGQIFPADIECSDDQVYFIYIGSCRPLQCPLEMYPYKGQCLLRDVAVANKSLLLFPNGTHQLSFHVIIENSSHHDVQVRTAVQTLTATFEMVLNQTTNITKSVTSSSFENTSHWVVDIKVESVYSTVRDMVHAAYLALNNPVELLQTDIVRTVTVLLSNINETLINETGSCSTGVVKFESQNLTLETNGSGEYYVRRLSTFYPIDRIGFTLQLYPTDNATVSLVQAVLCVLQDPDIPNCPTEGAAILSQTSYIIENGILIVLPHRKQYKGHEFVIRADRTAAVCNSLTLDDERYLLLFRFYFFEQLATFICLLVSIVSLLLVLITYSLLPKLRNVPGIIVMSLSASMLMMQVLMLLMSIPRGWLCLAVAWLLHLSLLATFLWNSALAFDLAFTLRSQSFGRMSKRSRGRVLRCYIMLCWMLPLLVVVSLGVMDHYGVYDVGYAAGGQCFIGTRSAILWLVITPMSLTLLFNCACFVCAFSTIFHTAKLMQKSTTSSQGGSKPEDKRRAFIYIRITLIMGFTWVFCFVAAVVDLEELWIAHIVLNASQGLYFFISFVLKRRVLIMLRDRFSSFQPSREETVATPQRSMTLSRVTMET